MKQGKRRTRLLLTALAAGCLLAVGASPAVAAYYP
jgi:hypothetical protein